jgi:hypothetical protein
MKRDICSIFIILFLVSILCSCSHHVEPKGKNGQGVASPACIIYKTRSDYAQQVPVILNAGKTAITSYPDIKDIYYQGKLAYPTRLDDGFLLDNRGIGPNVAFLDYTYEEYSKLVQTPTIDQLFSHILEKDPLTEMYKCGKRIDYHDIENDLNKLITSGKLNSCEKIK